MNAIDEVVEDYQGPATVDASGAVVPVRVVLTGRFEPIDGRYHWGGRIEPHQEVQRLVRDGQRVVTVQIEGRPATPARLSEVDPWGGVRVLGAGRPPWTHHEPS